MIRLDVVEVRLRGSKTRSRSPQGRRRVTAGIILRGDGANAVPCRFELPPPVERTGAGFDTHGARRQCFDFPDESIAADTALQHKPATRVLAARPDGGSLAGIRLRGHRDII